MPNNVYSRIKFSYHDDKGEMIEKISKEISSEHNLFDFDKLIPMPKEIVNSDGWTQCKWANENWGTKWSACDVKLISKREWSLIIDFWTAWSYPKPIIEKLIEKYPGVEITYTSADNGGWFAYHVYKNPDSELIERSWTSENDPEYMVRNAMLEALNYSH